MTVLDTLLTHEQFVFLWVAWVIVTVGTAMGLRRLQRLPFFKPRFGDVQFDENWCSGASSAGLMGKLGWARNCLWIVVDGDHLHVGPHFPFNLFLLRFFFGLDLSVPLVAVTSVEGGAFARVKISYSVSDDARGVTSARSLTVQCWHPDRLIEILRERMALARRG